MKNISGYIINAALLWLLVPCGQCQDTLRTYGPRLGIDLVSFAYYFADPSRLGGEASLDFEVYENFYPVLEAGYTTVSDDIEESAYSSGGTFGRIGLDYNLLPNRDRSVHHSITVGLRYALSAFTHQAENILLPSDYWGDMVIDRYENSLKGHWLELVGGVKTEVASNFFLGLSVRYRLLLNPDMDPQVVPLLVPGYGRGTEEREFGFTYSLYYKIPLLKR